MAITVPVNIAGHATFSGAVSSFSAPVTVAAPAGSIVLLGIYVFNTSGDIVSVTDTKGNTYTVNQNSLDGTIRTAVVSAANITALTTSDTITVTWSNSIASGSTRVFYAWYTEGVAVIPLTGSTSGSGSSGRWDQDLGTMAEDSIAFFVSTSGISSQAHTPDANTIELLDADFGGSNKRLVMGYKLFAAGAAGTMGGNFANVSPTRSVSAKYKAKFSRIHARVSGSFTQKTVRVKLSGSLVEKPSKTKIGGTFV